MIITIFFWISLAVLFYCYLGYGILVLFINTFKSVFIDKKRKDLPLQGLSVTIIITAYNEEAVLEQKIKNTLAIDYPAGQLHIIFITDGSSDDPAPLFNRYPSITLLHQPERKGKYAAIKRAMQKVQTPVVVFSDANTMLNKQCINNIVLHYADEKTGAVAGEKKITGNKKISVAGEAERIYWKYESFMKKLDAGLYTVTGAAGELFSIRTNLFKALDDEVILDDFIISMQVCLQGYKIAYAPDAFATELPSASLAEEEKRKVRISAGAYQSISYLKDCLNIFKHPLLSFQFMSRRLLRWIFCPPLLVVLLLTNILIVFLHTDTYLYDLLLYAQAGFYLLALSGWIMARSGKKTGIFTIPFYFIFMNYCLVKGFVKFIKGRQSVLWEKSLRQAVSEG
ncbi:MAG TPA: glycosyltransferase family 2 protein [Chitinophagaceae bacterium]|nr:glycosyltransferase family 2 protein [Chitinophagaceae bacterium]